MGLFGFPTYTVARELDNPYLDRFVNDFRGRTGQYMLPKKGSGDDIQRVLERGGILTLLGDQHAGQKAVLGQFLRPARLDAQSGGGVLARQRCADDGQLRPPARQAAALRSRPRGDLRSARSEFRIRQSRCWPSGTPTTWKISSADRPTNTGGSTDAGKASRGVRKKARSRNAAKWRNVRRCEPVSRVVKHERRADSIYEQSTPSSHSRLSPLSPCLSSRRLR